MRKILFLFISSLLFSSSLLADDAGQLVELIRQVDSIQAGFKQTVVDEVGEPIEEGSGHLYFQRPNKLRWEVEEPYNYLVITNGQTVWRYDADLEQLNTDTVDEAAKTPMMILAASPEELTSQYSISASTRGGLREFTLIPKQSNQYLSLQLNFLAGATGMNLVEMELRDALGQTTSISLANETPGQWAANFFSFDALRDARP